MSGRAAYEILVPERPSQSALQTLFDPAFADEALAILDQVCSNALAGDWFVRHAEADRSRQTTMKSPASEIRRMALL